jgi:uncharacterized lipoprotein YajG
MNVDGLAGDQIVLTSHETLFSGLGCQLWKRLIRRCFPFLACIFLVVLVGCVVIPTPEHDLLEGRGKIDESDIAFLTLSKTTREEVLLRFGEPDLVLHDNRILIYRWMVSAGYWAILVGNMGAIPKDYWFMLEFDGEGRLKRFKRSGSKGSGSFSRIDDWTPLNSKKLSGIFGERRNNIFIDPIPSTCAQTATLDIESRPTRFRIGEFFDNRASPHTGTFIGYIEYSSANTLSANVETCRPANVMIRAAVTNQLQAMGHKLVSKDADVTITGKITKFEVTTSQNWPKYVFLGSLDVILEVQPSAGTNPKNIRRYKAKAKNVSTKSFAWNYSEIEDIYEQIMQACLEDMQRQIASDAELARLLGRRTQ